MKITMITYGIRAQIDTFLALALELRELGFEVQIASSSRYENRFSKTKIAFSPIRSDFHDLFRGEAGRMITGSGLFAQIKSFRSMVLPMLKHTLKDAVEAASDSRALILDHAFPGGYLIAEKLKIPAFYISEVPVTKTGAFPAPGTIDPDREPGRKINQWSYLFLRLKGLPYLPALNRFRTDSLGLKKRSLLKEFRASAAEEDPLIYPFSSSLINPPEDWKGEIWQPGFFRITQETNKPEGDESETRKNRDLQWFLEDGSPPVFIHYEIADEEYASWLVPITLEALHRSGQRGVVATGYQGLHTGNLGSNILLVDPEDISPEQIYPFSTAVVHNGSLHSVAWTLHSGRPSVLCPFHPNEEYLGKVLHDAGAGPSPLSRNEITVERLTKAIRAACTNPDYRIAAGSLRDRIKSENGAKNCAHTIQQYLEYKNTL